MPRVPVSWKSRRGSNALAAFVASLAVVGLLPAPAGQAPFSEGAADIPISHSDRVYAAEQYSNTVSVTDPVDNRLLGVVRLGGPSPSSLSPLYTGQLLVHGMGFSPDRKTLAVVAVGSISVTFIDTATNAVKHVAYVGRAPHEAFFTPDGREVWITVRGENYVDVLDASTYAEKMRITVPKGPGMQIFSPDGKYGYVCSSLMPETVVVDVATHQIVGHVAQASPFCPNIAATPDGTQVWFMLKDTGKVRVFGARPPFAPLKTLDAGPITNHVNIVHNANGTFAYVTVGGLNQIQVYRTSDFARVATIRVGALPHGIWPSGDGTRVYVGLENADKLVAIDTLMNKVIASVPIGQAAQAVVYVPGAVPTGSGTENLEPLVKSSAALHLSMVPATGKMEDEPPTSVSLFDQGLVQVLEAAVTGLAPKHSYVLALATRPDGTGTIEPLARFTTNPAGSAVVNAIGRIRQSLEGQQGKARRYLVIFAETNGERGRIEQIQAPRLENAP